MSKNNTIDMTQLIQAAAMAQQNQTQQSRSGGWLSYWETLSLVLLILNAMNFIAISWIWVFFPLFIPAIVYTFILVFGFIKGKFFS